MFKKDHLDAFYGELDREWKGKTEYEQLLRDAHLGLALSDAGRPLGDRIDPIVASLIEKHRPKE